MFYSNLHKTNYSRHHSLFFFTTIFISLFTLFFLNSSIAFASSYYVSTSGNDKNAGTIKKPFKSIQHALDIVNAGDNVYVRKGTYNEQLTIKTSGTQKAPICLCNYNNEAVIVDGSKKSAKNSYGNIALLSIINKNYIHVSGIEFKNLSTTSTSVIHGITVLGYGEGISIKNCKVSKIETKAKSSDANGHGISVYGFDPNKPISNIILDGNEVCNCKLGSSESMVLNGNVTNFTVTNNIIHDNDNIGIDFIGHEGICKSTEKDSARDGICSDNYVYNICSKNNPVYNGSSSADGIYVDGGKNIIIERNIVKNCDIGIAASSENHGYDANNIIIRNNLVTDCLSYAGITFGGCSSENGVAKNIKIFNNTIYHCKTGIVIQNANSSSNEVKNNIIYNCVLSPMYGNINKNIVSNNFTANPSFVDESKGNFRLKNTSSAIDKGVTVNCGDYDLDKNMRIFNGVVDMGCYEYVKEFLTISVDGSSRDWQSVPSISNNTGNLKELKAYKDNDYLYICAIGSKLDSYPNVHLYINADNSTKTGFADGGADYLIENKSLYKYSLKYGTSWDFEYITSVDSYSRTSNCIEFKIALKNLKNLSKTLNLKMILLNKNWNAIYQIPPLEFATYK